MSTYESIPTTIEAMRWNGMPTMYVNHPDWSAEEIVAWVNANGGEARYERADPRLELPVPHRIAIHTINGWASAAPGHYVLMGTATFVVKEATFFSEAERCRDFYPCDPETFAKRWRPKND